MQSYQDKHYGLAGQTVMVKEKSKAGSPYPWNGHEVPVQITAEYPSYLLGTVMPHRNQKGLSASRPYPVTIDKFDIHSGKLIINGGAVR